MGSGVFVTVGEAGREVGASVAVVVMVTGADSGGVVGFWLLAPGKQPARKAARTRMMIVGAIFSFISDSILSLEQPQLRIDCIRKFPSASNTDEYQFIWKNICPLEPVGFTAKRNKPLEVRKWIGKILLCIPHHFLIHRKLLIPAPCILVKVVPSPVSGCIRLAGVDIYDDPVWFDQRTLMLALPFGTEF